MLLDLLINRVVQIDGTALKYSGASSRSGVRALCFSVDKVDFQIPYCGIWQHLPDGARVRTYYTPLAKHL